MRPPWLQDMQWKMSTNHCVQKKWLNIETLYSFLLIRSSWKSGYCNINHLLRKKLFPMTRLYSFHKGFRSECADPFPSLRSALKLFFFLTLLMAKYLLLISLTILANIANHQDRSFTLYSASKETSKKFDFLGEKKRILLTRIVSWSRVYCFCQFFIANGFVVINYVRNILS